MKIGLAAKLSYSSVSSIRRWQREGVIDEPARTPSGYRWFSLEDIEKIKRQVALYRRKLHRQRKAGAENGRT